MTLTVSGTLPGLIAENSGPDDWFGLLQVSADRGTIASITAVGPGADFLSLTWDPVTGTVAIRPAAPLDYEAFIDQGLAPELTFSLQATMRNGRVDSDAPSFTIALLDRDDTAPTALSFASGGSVEAGALGAVIGTLSVTDPDSSGPFYFSFTDEDDWRFEIVGGDTLKLRDGITLGLDDMPVRPLLLTVSDGVNSAGFVLDLSVLDPSAPPPADPVLDAGGSAGAVALPDEDHALVLRDSTALLALGTADAGTRSVMVSGEPDATIPDSVRSIEFTDARLEIGGNGPAAQATAVLQAVTGNAAPEAVATSVAALDSGAALVDQAAAALGTVVPAPSVEDFVTGLFQQAAGRDPSAAELALQIGRLGTGESRAQVALDVALALAAGSAADETWLPWSHGHDTPEADAALPSVAVTPGFAAELLIG